METKFRLTAQFTDFKTVSGVVTPFNQYVTCGDSIEAILAMLMNTENPAH